MDLCCAGSCRREQRSLPILDLHGRHQRQNASIFLGSISAGMAALVGDMFDQGWFFSLIVFKSHAPWQFPAQHDQKDEARIKATYQSNRASIEIAAAAAAAAATYVVLRPHHHLDQCEGHFSSARTVGHDSTTCRHCHVVSLL